MVSSSISDMIYTDKSIRLKASTLLTTNITVTHTKKKKHKMCVKYIIRLEKK